MKTLFSAKILNPYLSHVPKGFYDKLGHRGVDLDFRNESIPAPCDLTILLNENQREMGKVVYAKDENDCIFVFAHCSKFVHKINDKVLAGEVIAASGNTGTKTTASHLHLEILAPRGTDPQMRRYKLPFEGDNINPMNYLNSLIKAHMAQKVSEWAAKAQKNLTDKGITDGSSPHTLITREEVWVMFDRMCNWVDNLFQRKK